MPRVTMPIIAAHQLKMPSRPRHLRFAYVAFALVGVGGCAHVSNKPVPSRSTSFAVFIPPGATGFQLADNQHILLGEPIVQLAPAYPAALVTKDIPLATVCLSIAINEHGAVYLRHPLFKIPGCPTGAQSVAPEFVAASENAVMRWRFPPALLCTLKPGVDPHGMPHACPGPDADAKAIPISLAFRFTFTQADGKTLVQAKPLTPAH